MVHRPNPVQSIRQQRQEFSTPQIQPMPMMGQPTMQSQAIRPPHLDELAIEIYARLVSGKYLDPNYRRAPDESNLRQWARDAQAAATAYFATLEETPSNG